MPTKPKPVSDLFRPQSGPQGSLGVPSAAVPQPPDHDHTCDTCAGRFPCWDKACIVGTRFICDDCAEAVPFEELLGLAAYEPDPSKRQELVRRINERCERQERGIVSTDSFDIFRGTPDEHGAWLESVVGLDQAKDRLKQLASEFPGSYFIFHAPSQTVLNRIR